MLRVGNLSFNTLTREAEVSGELALLTPKEQTLVEHLMRKPGGVVSKVFLEDHIYGSGRDASANSLEVLTHRLRARLRGTVMELSAWRSSFPSRVSGIGCDGPAHVVLATSVRGRRWSG